MRQVYGKENVFLMILLLFCANHLSSQQGQLATVFIGERQRLGPQQKYNKTHRPEYRSREQTIKKLLNNTM